MGFNSARQFSLRIVKRVSRHLVEQPHKNAIYPHRLTRRANYLLTSDQGEIPFGIPDEVNRLPDLSD
jgi:hypothetical protein